MLGSHVLFQQYNDDKPVTGAWVRVDIDPEGNVYGVLNDLLPNASFQKSNKSAGVEITSDAAVVKAKEAIGADGYGSCVLVEDPEHLYYPHNATPLAAWKVLLRTSSPTAEWRVYVDAVHETILEKYNQLKQAEKKEQSVSARVFDPNPVVTLNDTTLTDQSLISDAAYVEVQLLGLQETGYLDGIYVSTKLTANRIKVRDHDFSNAFQRGHAGFKEIMVYFHIDRAQRHLQDLGFNNVLNEGIPVNVDGPPDDDNSFYSPAEQSLTFGGGGVDDAEDAEVILHEYGHAIQDAQVKGFGRSKEGQAMGEGFGDFFAASFFEDRKPVSMKMTVANWDAVAYSGDEPPSLRRLDSNKKYPRDITGEHHSDGEIWSACLWELRSAMGRVDAEKLVIAHHYQLSPSATFEDGANGLITADKVLNKGGNTDKITEIFVRRGILPNEKRQNLRAGALYSDGRNKTGHRK